MKIMNKIRRKSKMTLEKLAKMTQDEFLVTNEKIRNIRKDMVTKSDLKEELKHFATKDDLKNSEVTILRAVDKIVDKFDRAEKENAAHLVLHHRITDQFHNHDVRIKKLEARV